MINRLLKAMLLAVGMTTLTSSLSYASDMNTGKLYISGNDGERLFIDIKSGQILDGSSYGNKKSFNQDYLNISQLDQNRLLYESNNGTIGILDLSTNKEQTLFKNSDCPVYFEDTNEVLFSKRELTKDGWQSSFYISDISGRDSSKLIKLGITSSSTCPIKLDSQRALLFSGDGEEYQQHIFNVRNRQLTPAAQWHNPIYSLAPNRMLCKDESAYFIADDAGNKVQSISNELLDPKGLFPIANLASIHSILVLQVTESWFSGQSTSIWLLNLDTFEKRLLLKGFSMSKSGAVYLEADTEAEENKHPSHPF